MVNETTFTKYAKIALQCVSNSFRHFLDLFLLSVAVPCYTLSSYTLSRKNKRNNIRESGKGFRLNFLYQHAEWTTSMSLILGNFDFHFRCGDMANFVLYREALHLQSLLRE